MDCRANCVVGFLRYKKNMNFKVFFSFFLSAFNLFGIFVGLFFRIYDTSFLYMIQVFYTKATGCDLYVLSLVLGDFRLKLHLKEGREGDGGGN